MTTMTTVPADLADLAVPVDPVAGFRISA